MGDQVLDAGEELAVSEHLARGLNVAACKIRHPAVAEALGLPSAA